jgi:YesN/AraC family two-component response regulator
MERVQPFCQLNFNISHLAIALDSNVSYVSNVIKRKTGMHVIAFINSYRVEFAKKALQKADAKFTIEHFSQSSGFKNQTTFNRVFKVSEGLTPTEYMNMFQKENSEKEARMEN